jgi:uncharacterized protein (DUF302 family)
VQPSSAHAAHDGAAGKGDGTMIQGMKEIGLAALLGLALVGCASESTVQSRGQAGAAESGVVAVRSAYAMDETVTRLKRDIAGKGLMFFDEVDQSQLAADAGIALRPSILLLFGNPALGSQFMTSNPRSGIDWPVRLLVYEDANGQVWAAYSDFAYIKDRHGITDRDPQFAMAAEVIASITDSVTR